ncbi:multicopper oxidase-domain-containing protein [Choanephora cucurbitarum]|nr:multicopper oxidase-domain-containing protein [Choanephora cucurbitarum]
MQLYLIILTYFVCIHTKRVEYDWFLQYKHVNPDGLYERRVISINNQWPPVPVRLQINDTLVLNVYNQLNEPTVIHSHGILQNNGSHLYDGAVMVTQCPISPHSNFTYVFPVTQAGTFWMHSHFKVQYMDGLRVPLIVYDPDEPMEYDQDEIVTVSEWYHQDTYLNLEKYMHRDNLEGIEPIPQSGLINDNRQTYFQFRANKTYRLRLINMSGMASFRIYLEDHTMEIIELDGVLTQPTLTSSVYLSAGQRMSVLIETKQTTEFNYYLHADMDPDMFDTLPDDLLLNITAPVYYDTHHDTFKRVTTKTEYAKEDILIPPWKHTDVLIPDLQINMTMDFMVNTDGLNHGVINTIPYLPPLVPTLHTLLTMGDLAKNTKVYGPQSQAYVFQLNQVIEIVLNNLDDGMHPFHLHGHVFQVIARGEGIYYVNQTIHSSYPTVRDTITVPANGYLILRFKADNPGVWFFHCHVDWHLPAGLAATFITAPELVQQQTRLPSSFDRLCHDAHLPSRGNAAGREGLDLKGVPDGIRPVVKTEMLWAGWIATFFGFSSILWHVWTNDDDDDDGLIVP